MPPMFGPPKENSARSWKETSFDFRLHFVFHIATMVLFMTGGSLTVQQELWVDAIVLIALLYAAIRHRRRMNWKRPALHHKDIFSAIGSAALIGVFLFAATPLFPPTNPRSLPWYLAGVGIGAFGILGSLRIVYKSEIE